MKNILITSILSLLLISCASSPDRNFVRDYTVGVDFVSKITKNQIYNQTTIDKEKKISMIVSFKSSHTFKKWNNYNDEMAWANHIKDKLTLKGYKVKILYSNDNSTIDTPRLNINVSCQTPNCRCSGFHEKGLMDNLSGKGFLFKRITSSITDSTGEIVFSEFDGYGPEKCLLSSNKETKVDALTGQLDKVFKSIN